MKEWNDGLLYFWKGISRGFEKLELKFPTSGKLLHSVILF